MSEVRSATVTTTDASVAEQLAPFTMDVEGAGTVETPDSFAEFMDTAEPGEHTSEKDKVVLRGVKFVYGDAADAEDAVSFETLRSLAESVGTSVEYPSDDPFYRCRLGNLSGDFTRDILDGDVNRLHAIASGDTEGLGFDSQEDAIVNLSREYVGQVNWKHDKKVNQFLSGFDLSDDEEELACQTVDEYRLDENPFDYLGLDIQEDPGRGYYFNKEGKKGEKPERIYVTNFLVDVLAHLDVNGERRVLLRIKPSSPRDPAYTVEVPMTVFNDVRTFTDNVFEEGKTVRWDGTQRHLNDLKEYIGSVDAPDKIGISKITIIDGQLITPKGVLAADGWVDDSEFVYVSTGNDIEKRWSLSPDENPTYDDEEVAGLLELLPQVRSPERIIPTIGWFYSLGFRDLIYDLEDGFNAHNVFGQSEAGKSPTLRKFGTMWGMNYQDKGLLSTNVTRFALESAFSLTEVAPLLFDEFKPADLPPHKIKRFKEFLRNATGGASIPKGTKSQDTIEYDFETPVAFAGEQAVTGVAETRRAIPTVYELEASRPGTPTEQAWAELTGESYEDPEAGDLKIGRGYNLEDHALAYYRFVLSQDREEMSDLWMDSKQTAIDWTSHFDIDNLKQMHVQGFSTILFGVRLMNRLAEEVGLDEAPIPEEVARDAVEYVAGLVGERSSMSDLDTFLYYCGLAAKDGALELNDQYKFVHYGTNREELRINLTYAHDKVMTWVNKTGKDNTNLLTNPSDYRMRFEEAFESDDPAIKTVYDSSGRFGIPTAKINRAIGVDVDILEERIEGFSRHMFVAEETHTEYADGSVSVDHSELATPISELTTGQYTLTVTVDRKAADPPMHFAEKGVLTDETGTVEYIIWSADQSDVEEVRLEPGRTYCLHNALVNDYEGQVQVQISPGVTEVQEIEPGRGYSETEESAVEAEA